MTTIAATGAVSNPRAGYSSVNPRVGAIVSLHDAGEVYGNVSRLFEAPTTFQLEVDSTRPKIQDVYRRLALDDDRNRIIVDDIITALLTAERVGSQLT